MLTSTGQDGTLEVFQMQAEVCKSLADSKRLMIIHELRAGEKSVSELSEAIGVNQSNTSQHLAVLRRVGLVVCRKEGTTVYYSLANTKITEACDMVRQVLMERLEGSKELASRISRL